MSDQSDQPKPKIPVSFQLMSRTINVEFERVPDDAVACWSSNRGRISIEPGAPDDHAYESFCHELTHAILDTLSYEDLSRDEAFVDRFGRLLAQVLTSADYGG